MKLLTFHGTSTTMVMDQIRNQFGPDAILVAERKDDSTGVIEILAASAPHNETGADLFEPALRNRLMNWAEQFSTAEAIVDEPTPDVVIEVEEHVVAPQFLDAGFSESFTSQLADFLPLIDPSNSREASNPEEIDGPNSFKNHPPYTLENLSHAFAQIAGFAPLGDIPDHPILLSGPPGSGKSLTIVKLAARSLFAGALPRIIIVDPLNLGPGAPLTMFAKVAPVDIETAHTPEDLTALLQSTTDKPVFIDSWGVNPLDQGEIAALSSLTTVARNCEAINVGVIPAGISKLDAQDTAHLFTQLSIEHTIITRCDTTRMPGTVMEAVMIAGLLISELGVSSRPTPGLVHANPTALAKLFPDLCRFQKDGQEGECAA